MTGSDPRSPERTRSTNAANAFTDAARVLDADIAAVEQGGRLGALCVSGGALPGVCLLMIDPLPDVLFHASC